MEVFLIIFMFKSHFVEKKTVNSIVINVYFSDHNDIELQIRSKLQNNIHDNIDLSMI